MTRRIILVTLAAAILVPFTIGQPASAARLPAGWSTCVPRQIDYQGIYRYDNDLFAGKAGPSCITVRDGILWINSSYGYQAGGVVADPLIRVGPWYTSLDPRSGLPYRTEARKPWYADARVLGNATGHWLADIESWYYPSRDTNEHGNAEVVIAVRWNGWEQAPPGPQWTIIRVDHQAWYADHWTARYDGFSWPLTVLVPAWRIAWQAPGSLLSVRLPLIIWHLRLLGWMPAREWLGNVALQAECWSGCKGLGLQLQIVRTAVPPPVPVIEPPPPGS